MKTILINLFATILFFGLSGTLQAQEFTTHNFNDGNFFPYVVPKPDQRARVKIVNRRVETHWDQALYNGTNSGRKAQIKQAGAAITDEIIFTQHIWMGFWLKIHGDYMRDNTNTNAGLMQIWGHNGISGAANHMAMLKFDGRNGGALVWQHRYNSVAKKTHHLIYPNFPKDKFVRVVMHIKLAERDKGLVQVWVDDELRLNESNQTIGWGEQDATGMINGTYAHGTSIGQYNYFENANYDDAYDGDNHYFFGHMEGETRTVTYDNVSLYSGADGYSLVDPNGGRIPTNTSSVVQIKKRNASNFAMDGGRNGANGQNIQLEPQSSRNVNQNWIETVRGGNYYSYRKEGTNFCIDGNGGGATNQNVYLWQCSDNNQNQHWQKVDAGAGFFKLIKRNAPGFALNGGSGGSSSQNINLYDSSNSSQNLQWSISR